MTAQSQPSPNKRMIEGVLANDCMAVVDALADGADPVRQTVKDVTVLTLAVRMGYIDIVAAMLHAGAPVDHQLSPQHRTALFYAIECDVADMSCKRTALLLGYGADPDVTFTYEGKPGSTVDALLDAKQAEAMPPEEVTINDLRAMLAARRSVLAQDRMITQRRQLLLKGAQGRKYKL